MKRNLILTFETETSQNKDFIINNVKENITEEEVRAIADAMISENIFFTNSGDYKNIISAKVKVETIENII